MTTITPDIFCALACRCSITRPRRTSFQARAGRKGWATIPTRFRLGPGFCGIFLAPMQKKWMGTISRMESRSQKSRGAGMLLPNPPPIYFFRRRSQGSLRAADAAIWRDAWLRLFTGQPLLEAHGIDLRFFFGKTIAPPPITVVFYELVDFFE